MQGGLKSGKRRRLMQAALAAAGGALLPGARGEVANRNLVVHELPPPAMPGTATSASLLLAPRRALVIGNSRYVFGTLANPGNDARAIADQLKAIGFQVTLGVDLPQSDMMAAIRAYGESLAREKPIGLFYFAGHGMQLSWRNYLFPVDAKVDRLEDVQARCVDVNAVIDGIAKATNPMNVVILDACRDNPFERNLQQKGLSQLDAPPDTLLAYATAPGNVASDGAGEHGLYTENLLREMKVPDTKIEDVFKRVRLAVRRTSNGQQIPWESTSLEQDFYFLPPKKLKKEAEEEREREFKAQQALWEKVQEEEKKRRAEAERIRKEKEEAERIAQARLEEQRRQEEAERERIARQQEAIRQALAEAEARRAAQEKERLRKEQQALEAQRKAAEQKRAEEAQRAEKAREEAARMEAEKLASLPVPVEDYLRRYPSGYFSEIAEFELDRALEREGEKKIQIVTSPENPYTHGSARSDTRYRVGDHYTYRLKDLYSGAVMEEHTETITAITDDEVIYNDGERVTDLLGNPLKTRDGRSFSLNQGNPLEFVVGKSWTSRFTTRNRKRHVKVHTEIAYRIVGVERIVVPAGTFDAFVVVGQGWSVGNPNGPLQIQTKAWHAPTKVRRPVAAEFLRRTRTRNKQAERDELVSFSES